MWYIFDIGLLVFLMVSADLGAEMSGPSWRLAPGCHLGQHWRAPKETTQKDIYGNLRFRFFLRGFGFFLVPSTGAGAHVYEIAGTTFS